MASVGAQRTRSESEGRWSIRKADEACGPSVSERSWTRPGWNRRKEDNRIIKILTRSQGHETMSLALFYLGYCWDDLGYIWDELNF